MAQGVDGYWYAYIGAYGFIDASGTDDFDSTDNYLDYGVDEPLVQELEILALIGQHHLGAAGTGQASHDLATGASTTMLTATSWSYYKSANVIRLQQHQQCWW